VSYFTLGGAFVRGREPPLHEAMSALGHKRTCAMQNEMSAYRRKQTCAVQLGMSALGQKRTSKGDASALLQ